MAQYFILYYSFLPIPLTYHSFPMPALSLFSHNLLSTVHQEQPSVQY